MFGNDHKCKNKSCRMSLNEIKNRSCSIAGYTVNCDNPRVHVNE